MKTEHMAQIAEWMKLAIDFRNDEEKLAEIKQEVRDFALKFPLPSDSDI
jgi:glycine/serine hydroxymethyltransferase